jgi:hypothetical protein
MPEAFKLATVYRIAYGFVRRRLEELPVYFDPLDLVVDPAEAVGRLDPAMADDPEVAEAIRDGIEDARAGRRPKW